MRRATIFKLLIIAMAFMTIAGCMSDSTEQVGGSNETKETESTVTTSQLPFVIQGIKDEVCSSGYFVLNFQIKNVSTRQLKFTDIKDFGVEVLLKSEAGDILTALPVSFYGSLTPGLDATVEPNAEGTLTIVNDGFEGTLASIDVQFNGESIFEASAEFPAPLRDRNWVIKDGLCN